MSTPRSMKSRSFWTTAFAAISLLFGCDAAKKEERPFRVESPEPGLSTPVGKSPEPLDCEDGMIEFEGKCELSKKVVKKLEENDDSAVVEVVTSHDSAKKAKATNRLIRSQEKQVDVAEQKLDAILEDLREDEQELEALEDAI